MPFVKTDSQHYTDIADAIRAKHGVTTKYLPEQMASAVRAITGKEDLSWHQCPEAVRNYLANVDYTGVPYTQSSISEYAPTPSVIANAKPIGKTVDGVTYYNTIPNADTPFASANAAGTLNPLDQVRWINSRTSNMRDLGGWPCDGGKVKYGLLYRSGELNAQDEDLLINELGINTECDLTADGVAAFPGKMRFIGHTSYAMYSLADTGAWRTNLRGIFEAVQYGDPVVFHCSMGADRTGTLACVLEGLLGMSRSDIDKDYELTSFYALRARNGNYQGGTADWAHLIGQIQALSGDTFRDKCVTFVRSLGFTIAEINAYRHAMIDGNPQDIVAPTYTVTNTLTGCATSNAETSANEGDAYAAVITANSGYTLMRAAISVTMGGADITASAYNNGSISIASVTGNVVITIVAAEEAQLKELFNASAATINQRFSSSGAYTALNGNFCTDFISVSGLDSTDPWRIHIKDTTTATRFQAMGPDESVMYYKSDKTVIDRLMVSTATSGTLLTKHNDSGGGIYVDINVLSNGSSPIPFDLSQVAYIRVCMAYSPSTAIPDTATLANVSIKADNITDGGGSEPVTHSITNTLTNCTTNNNSASVESGQSYSATISANSGYTLSGATVQITMGGANITSTAYSNGAISIANVTGDIVIQITAVASTPTNLFDPNDSDVTIGARINSSGNAVAYAEGQLVTGFIPASDGDVFRIETDKSLTTNNYTGMVGYYDSSKTYKVQSGNNNTAVWSFSDSNMTGVCTLSSTVTGVGYVRFCVAYTDINNIKIYKQ